MRNTQIHVIKKRSCLQSQPEISSILLLWTGLKPSHGSEDISFFFLFCPDASDIISHSLLFIKICFWDLLKLLQGSQLFHLLICLSQPVFLYPSRLRHREVCVFLLRQEVFFFAILVWCHILSPNVSVQFWHLLSFTACYIIFCKYILIISLYCLQQVVCYTKRHFRRTST